MIDLDAKVQTNKQTNRKTGNNIMGTRSLTVVQEDGKDICVMYRQYDGYPEAHGKELADFLRPIHIGNGFQEPLPGTFANGLGCLAAQIITHFKKDSMIGGFYLHPSGTRDCGEEFTYVITAKNKKPFLSIHEGTIAAFGMPGAIKSEDMPCIWSGFASDFDLKTIEAALAHH